MVCLGLGGVSSSTFFVPASKKRQAKAIEVYVNSQYNKLPTFFVLVDI